MARIKKAQNGDRTVDLPDVKIGYKAKVMEKVSPEGVRTAKVKVKRNVGGLLLGKKKGVTGNLPVYNVPQGKRESPERERSGRAGMKEAKNGKWIQKATASIKKRGTAGKCTPITKPGCTGRAKALAKTFKKMAKARKGK